MPVSELRQTVRNLHFGVSQLESLIRSGSYTPDIITIYNEICDSIEELNSELEDIEGLGEDINLTRYSAA